jgi:hypothetical protein
MLFEPQDRIWAAGGRFRRWSGYSVEHYGEGRIDDGSYDTVRHVGYAPTTCLLVDSQVFRHIGLLDPRFFIYFEDADWVFRALKGGRSLYYTPATKLYHKVSVLTGGGKSPLVGYHFTRNRMLFLRKNIGPFVAFAFAATYELYLLARALFAMDSLKLAAAKQRGLRDGLRGV